MTEDRDDLVRIVFELEVDDEGWPPVGAERVWAEPLGSDTYRVDNTPWFARDVAADDIVRAIPPDDGSWPVYVETVRRSGNSTIRVIPFEAGPLGGSLQAILDLFTPHGAYGEGAGSHPVVALTLPPDADLRSTHALLREGKDGGWWDYEEACVDEAWIALDS